MATMTHATTKAVRSAERPRADEAALRSPSGPLRAGGASHVEPWRAVTPVRPDTAHVRALRFLDVGGELLAAVVLIVGGAAAAGFASML